MKTPTHVYFDNTRCKVVAWMPAVVCFEFMGCQLWRDKTAVSLTKGKKK